MPAPELHQLPLANPESLTKPVEYSITQDLAAKKTTARLHVETVASNDRLVLKSCYTVADDSPSDVSLQAEALYKLCRAEFDVAVHSIESTTSDRESFYHTVHIRITRDGKTYFEKDWSVEVPRVLN